MKKDRNYLINFYNATSTDDGKGEIETYEAWLERQLISRIEKIEKLEASHPSLHSKEQVIELIRIARKGYHETFGNQTMWHFDIDKESDVWDKWILSLSPVEGNDTPVMKECDLFQKALNYLDGKNISSLTDKGYIARWMANFTIDSLPSPVEGKDNTVGQSSEKHLTNEDITKMAMESEGLKYELGIHYSNDYGDGIKVARDFYEGKNETKG